MQVFRGVPAHLDSQGARPCVLTIGNFDGVHLGHQALITHLRERAAKLGLPATVLLFEPQPREFFSPASAPPRMSSLRRKLELLAAQGVDQVYIQRFDARFAALSADEFVDQVLVRGLRVRHLMIGDDFRFGKGRSGDFAALHSAGALRGFQVEAMPTLLVDGERASSSAVRAALMQGQIERAQALLGDNFELHGRVQHGDKIGRTIGYPTANIALSQKTLPISGIFAVTVSGAGLNAAPAAASIGVRPTIGDKLALRLEVYILDFDGDLYSRRLRIHFCHKIRDEAKFDSLAALTAAIDADCQAVKKYFAERPSIAPANTLSINSSAS